MNPNFLFHIVDAMDAIANYTDSSVKEIITTLIGDVFDEETAGELLDYYNNEY